MSRVFPKIVLALAGLCLVAPAPGSLSAQTIGLTLGDGTRASVSSGAKLTVPLNVDLANAGGTTLGALQAGVTWGVGKLRLDSVRVAAGSGFALTTNTSNVAGGQLLFNAYNPTGLTASGALVNLYFTGGTTGGGTSIELTPTAAGNPAGETIASQLVAQGLDVCVAGSNWNTSSAKWGDANANGAVNVTDAQQLARYAVALSVTNLLATEERGDVNADAVVDVLDALVVARFSAGLTAGARVNTLMVIASDLPPVAAVEVNPTGLGLVVGQKQALTVTPRAADGTSLAGCYRPTWSSSRPGVATVSSAGMVTAKAVGSTTILVAAGGKSATATVSVIPMSRSCLDALTANPSATTGRYTLYPDGTASSETTAQCDMATDGGGWTKVLGFSVTDGVAREIAGGDITAGLRMASRDSGMVNPGDLSTLRTLLNLKEFRFFCQKPTVGRQIHLKTGNQSVLDFLTNRTDMLPDAAGSFTAYPDDTSILAAQPSDWGYMGGVYQVGKWGHEGDARPRLTTHTMFIGSTAHWMLQTYRSRFECDDYMVTTPLNGVNGQWSVFVR